MTIDFVDAVKDIPLLIKLYDGGWRYIAAEVLDNDGSTLQCMEYPNGYQAGSASKIVLRLKVDRLECKDDKCACHKDPSKQHIVSREVLYGRSRLPVELLTMNEKELESFHRIKARSYIPNERIEIIPGGAPVRRRLRLQMQEEEQVQVLTPKEVAVKLIGVLSETPQNSKQLAAAAEIEYSELVIELLRRLAGAGKIKKITTTEGKIRWAKG